MRMELGYSETCWGGCGFFRVTERQGRWSESAHINAGRGFGASGKHGNYGSRTHECSLMKLNDSKLTGKHAYTHLCSFVMQCNWCNGSVITRLSV